MAKTRRLSANRLLVELIEEGMEAHRLKQQQFFELAERFAAPPILKKRSDSGINSDEWRSAADAQD